MHRLTRPIASTKVPGIRAVQHPRSRHARLGGLPATAPNDCAVSLIRTQDTMNSTHTLDRLEWHGSSDSNSQDRGVSPFARCSLQQAFRAQWCGRPERDCSALCPGPDRLVDSPVDARLSGRQLTRGPMRAAGCAWGRGLGSLAMGVAFS